LVALGATVELVRAEQPVQPIVHGIEHGSGPPDSTQQGVESASAALVEGVALPADEIHEPSESDNLHERLREPGFLRPDETVLADERDSGVRYVVTDERVLCMAEDSDRSMSETAITLLRGCKAEGRFRRWEVTGQLHSGANVTLGTFSSKRVAQQFCGVVTSLLPKPTEPHSFAPLSEPDEPLAGPSAIASVRGDPVEAAKGIKQISMDDPALVINGGYMEGAVLDASGGHRIADLESREVLLSKLAGAMKAKQSRAAATFAALLAKDARALGALQAKIEADPAAAVSATRVTVASELAVTRSDLRLRPSQFDKVLEKIRGAMPASSSWSRTPIDPSDVSPPVGVDVEAILQLSLAHGDPSISEEMHAARGLALNNDSSLAAPALEALVDAVNPVDAWCARAELGTLYMDEPAGSTHLREGLGMLLGCLAAPYRDIVYHAALNISEILRLHGSPEAHQGYLDLALALGNPLAMVLVAERAMEAEDVDAARAAWLRACAAIPRTNVLRTRAEVQLTNLWLGSAPEQIRRWFMRARGSLPQQVWDSSISQYFNTRNLYNVEGGSAGIATRYFRECPESCTPDSVTVECPHCGRNPRTLQQVASGDGDGVYPVLALFEQDDAVGAITVFKDALDDLGAVNTPLGDGRVLNACRVGVGSTLGQLLSATAPLVLGTLEVTDRLLFSDAGRSIDDRDVTVVVGAPAGQYVVVAWVSQPLRYYDTALRPLALAAVTGSLRAAVLDCVPALSDDERRSLIAQMWGDPQLLVNSHIASVRVGVAQANYDEDGESDPDRALSWLLQLAEFEDAGTYEILQSKGPFDDAYLRRLLADRGIMNPMMPWRRQPGGGDSDHTATKVLSNTVEADLIARVEAGDIFAWNDLGYQLVHQGHLEEGLEWLARSACAGVPGAMATYSWTLLLRDQPERAIALFDRAQPAMEEFVQRSIGQGEVGAIAPGQLANARSNIALSRLALGGTVQEALDVWSRGRWFGHVESKFYPAIVALRDGRRSDAEAMAETLTASERTEIVRTLHEVIDQGSGWFASWCREGLSILGDSPTGHTPGALSGARFCTQCGTERIAASNFCTACGAAF